MQDYPVHKAYRLIEPGPVILITTQPPSGPKTTRSRGRIGAKKRKVGKSDTDAHAEVVEETDDKGDGEISRAQPRPNIMTCGFHMVLQHSDPPLLGVVVGPWDTSFVTLRETRECVVAIPSIALATQTVDIGNCSSSEVDKFSKFGLTAVAAAKVGAPLVEECLANLECKVVDDKNVKKYNMWVLQVVKAWVRDEEEGAERRMFHHRGDGTFSVDGEIINLQDRMVLWKEYQD